MSTILSRTTKLPGKSFSLPTSSCKTGGKLRDIPDSVCSSCYAHNRGFYCYPVVKNAQALRLSDLQTSLISGYHSEKWIRKLAKAINRTWSPWFRWHDSGDLQSATHFEMICEVARRTPDHHHWLPTKEYAFLKSNPPPNLTVRKSAFMIDTPPKNAPGLWSFSYRDPKTIPSTAVICKATFRKPHSCGDCRACWSKDVKLVAYKEI